MSQKRERNAGSPLLEYYYNNSNSECGSSSDEAEYEESRWWNGEIKAQVAFSGPMIVTNFSFYFIAVLAVMFAGHLGSVELAASNLANSLASVSGFAFMIGLSGALETLCGQGYGAKLYTTLGLYLQASCIISLLFSITISFFWFFSEPILIFLRQDPEISKMTALYLRLLIPGLFAYGFLQNILRFLQTQSVILPLVVFSVFPLVIHFGITYFLVYLTPLGFIGAPLAVSITMWIAVIMLILYVLCSKKFEYTWNGFSFEALSFMVHYLKLALPSAAMICLEDGAFEILVLLSGLMPNSKITTSLVAMCVNTQAIAYMVAYGLSAATSTRVSNELGAGSPQRAKQAMSVSIKLSISLAIITVLGLALGHNIWAGFFSGSPIIIKEFASLTPFLVISIAIDSIQAVLSGVARGCGWQHVTVYINLATFYCIGMPVAIFLGFTFKLYAKGLWIGLICGLSCQACLLLLLTRRSNWSKLQLIENVDKESSLLCYVFPSDQCHASSCSAVSHILGNVME